MIFLFALFFSVPFVALCYLTVMLEKVSRNLLIHGFRLSLLFLIFL